MKGVNIEELVKDRNQKVGINQESYMQGMLYQKPVDYWDYIQVDTLLSLQKTRTDFKDEFIFVSYHQITELVLNMMLHEIKQIIEEPPPQEAFITRKMDRLIRYTEMLISSFSIMRDGMDYNDYNAFRHALAPASGFQSVQFRYIEIYCTRLQNLVSKRYSPINESEFSIMAMFEFLYWKDAGIDIKTGKKTLTLKRFEGKYQTELIGLAKKMEGCTIEDKIMCIQHPQESLIKKLKEFDYLYNVKWPLVHLATASHYLDKKGENKAATGGSHWKKYLHPKHQRRCFFPALWEKGEIFDWNK